MKLSRIRVLRIRTQSVMFSSMRDEAQKITQTKLSNKMAELRHLFRSAKLFMIAIGVVLILAALPSDGIGFSICPLNTITGINCPSCGLTRSVSSALHLELAKSYHYHPLGVPLMLSSAVFALSFLWRQKTYKNNSVLTIKTHYENVISKYRLVPVMILVFLLVWLIRII